MKTSLYSALLSTYSYTIHNGIKYFVCSFAKELIWHIACSYLQGTHLRQGWVKSLPHQLSLLTPVLTISPSPMATDLQPTTLKSPPSVKKKKNKKPTFFNTVLPEAYYPISFFLSVPLTIFSAFIPLLLPPKWTLWNIHCDCTSLLEVCEILLPLILIEIDTDISLCSWVLASLTNFNFKSFLSCSNCASSHMVLLKHSHGFSCSLPVFISIPLCRWLFPIHAWWSLLASQYSAQVTSLAEA